MKRPAPGKFREYARMLWFMFVTTAVFISAVSALHLATAATVQRNERLYLQRAVWEASGRDGMPTAEEIREWFDATVQAYPSLEEAQVFVLPGAVEAQARYVLIREGQGLWGPITAAVGLRADRETLSGVSFIEHNETPGLGARISETWFQLHLRGKRPPLELRLESGGKEPRSSGEMDAITGATITTRAVQRMLARVVSDVQAVLEEVQ